jgi:ABC transport system ATP-binding/permease protein
VQIPDVVVDGHRVEWKAGAVVTIGCDRTCNLVIEGDDVSRFHARIEARDDRSWHLVDGGSLSGTWLDGRRVTDVPVVSPATVRLGPGENGPSFKLSLYQGAETDSPNTEAAPRKGVDLGRLSSVYEPTTDVVTIGRDPANDIVISDDPRASRRHAEMRHRADGLWELRDLNSHNGTFLNGGRISRAGLSDGDVISLGNHVYRFHGSKLEEYSATDDSTLDVITLKVVADGGSTLLENVSFSIPSRSVLAIVGPSGAGKSTLLRALNGFAAPAEGTVRFAGRDLYSSYDELRARIGYVPQDDLVHPQLTVRQELEYAAALRLPPDLGKAGRAARVNEVIDELGLTERADLRIENLSGGQRKRASTAIELLTQPALLFLDEPTSGLDPGNEHQVMSVLRGLADGGRIVVVVTHATQSLSLVDRVLFLNRGGRVAYFGPPDLALEYFARYGVTGGFAEVFRLLEDPGPVDLAARFEHDADHARFVDRAFRQTHVVVPFSNRAPPTRIVGPVTPGSQLGVLMRRQLRLIFGDRRTVAVLAVQAPIFGLIIALLFPSHTISTSNGPFAALLLWLLVISATWLGASNSIREIVKESALFRRERAVGLSVPAYLGSKVVVFGTITIVQSIVLVLIGLSRQKLPPADPLHIVPMVNQLYPGLLSGLRPFGEGSVFGSQLFEIFVAVALSGLAAMALGLAVSARVQRSDQAIFALPIGLIVQMTLSLPLLQERTTNPILNVLGSVTSANWGMRAIASTTSLNQLMTSYLESLTIGDATIRQAVGRPYPDPYVKAQLLSAATGTSSWNHDAGAWLLAIAVLVVITAVLLGFAWYALARRDVGRRRRGGANRVFEG